MASRLVRLLNEQQEALDALTDREARRFLVTLEDSRRELLETVQALEDSGLDKVTEYTAQQKRVLLAQVDAGARQLRRRLATAADDFADAAAQAAALDVVNTVRAAEPDFTDAGGRLDLELARRLDEEKGLLLHRHSVDRYGLKLIEDFRRGMLQGLLQGESIGMTARRLLKAGGPVFGGMTLSRAELIVRMELNSGYNRMHLAACKATAEETDDAHPGDPMQRRAAEYLDARSHPISWALQGMVTGLDEPWAVPVAEVQAWAAKLGRGVGGITWELRGAHYVGSLYPAHFWERGRQVPTRKAWDDDAAFKRPHLPGSKAA